MPTNYYPNKTVDELKTILDSLQKRASTGVVFFTTAAGTQTQRSFQGSGPVDREIRRVLYALFVIEPENWDNPYAGRIRRTRPNYIADPGQTTVTLP